VEVVGEFKQVDGGWVYASPMSNGFGTTPENAYLAYLAGFEYRGPALPTKQAGVNIDSGYQNKEA
jgi:hypothetical protein